MPVSRYDQPAILRYPAPISMRAGSWVKASIRYCGISTQAAKKARDTRPDSRSIMLKISCIAF